MDQSSLALSLVDCCCAGPMWEQQNFYIIRGLRKYGYDEDADGLKAVTLATVRTYYERWGAVFEFYDALNTTDPTQCLRKPSIADSGHCKPGVMGVHGKCGTGGASALLQFHFLPLRTSLPFCAYLRKRSDRVSPGIRDYNFCAGLALLWLRGGE